MADLRALIESLGYRNVETLLNSGNAVFSAAVAPSATHALRIQSAVASKLGVDCLVIVKSGDDINAVVASNALKNRQADPSRLLVALTTESKTLLELEFLTEIESGADEIRIGTHAAYVWCANGILESKLAALLLKRLATTGTTRNWASIVKIDAMLRDHA
jgi:uncharacterized protein (DUF1697 family)